MDWEEKLTETFDRVLQDTPEMFRDVARKAVGSQAEANARDRGASRVTGEDLANAFISETPGVFQAPMLESLKREGLDIRNQYS